MATVSNQHRRGNLFGIRVQFITLMTKQGVHRRDANVQQRKQRRIKLANIAQLYQRGFPTLKPLTLQRGGKVIDRLVQLAVANLAFAINHRYRVAVRMAGQHVRQWQILPIAFFAIACRERVRPAGKFHGHNGGKLLVQAKYVQHGRKFDAGFTPFGLRR